MERAQVDPSWFRLSATALAARHREGALRSRALVLAHIDAIRARNPALNAMVADRFEAAVAEAEAADAATPGSLGPLQGVPCTVKETFELTGMPYSGGLPARKDLRATKDAFAVARLRAAGAIPLGVSNIPELAMWTESVNRVYGRTNNPYDLRRGAGGSSGGEGALVGAGLSPFGIGSDVGGSIRLPASFCGVFGHKPSGGYSSSVGMHPVFDGVPADARMLGVGPICRRAEDLYPLLKITSGHDPQDPTTLIHTPIGDPASVEVAGLRVLLIEKVGYWRPTKAVRVAQRRAAAALAARGAKVEVFEHPSLRNTIEMWVSRLFLANPLLFMERLGYQSAGRTALELVPWALGRSEHIIGAILLGLGRRCSNGSCPSLWRSAPRRAGCSRPRSTRVWVRTACSWCRPTPDSPPVMGIPSLEPCSWAGRRWLTPRCSTPWSCPRRRCRWASIPPGCPRG
jgi:fatty acid amide hydrolase 2